ELREMREQMGRLLGRFMMGRGGMAWGPAVDITERPNELVLTAERPGMRRGDIESELDNNVPTLRGEKKAEREEEGDAPHVLDRQYGSFARSFPLPRTVGPDRIHARFENGVLTVKMPKSEAAKGRKIDVEGGEIQH